MDILRGRVVDPDSQPVAGAHVVVRLTKGQETRETVTNAHGAYTVLFPGTAGAYTITARFIGMAPATVHVVRAGESRVLTADLILAPARGAAHKLAPVAVRAHTRPRPAREGDAPAIGAPALGDAWDDLRQPQDEFGDPNDPRRYAVLGTDPSESSLTVNGAEVQAVLPDADGRGARMTTTSADASMGGFSGGQIARGMGGGGDYHFRHLTATVAPAALQWVDRPSAAAGAESSTLRVGLEAFDPLFRGRVHHSSVLSYYQRTTPLPEFPTSPTGLARLGLASDSLARFLSLMGQAGIPATLDALPSRQRSSRLAWMGRIDVDKRANTSLSLVANLGTGGTEGAFLSPSALASHGGRTRQTGGFLTAALSRYMGNNYLTDFSTTVNSFATRVTPYLELPEGRVRVFSALPTGDSALTWLSFGGHPAAAGRSRTTTWQSRGSTTWHSADTTRRYRVGGEVFAERMWADQASNTRGAFEFTSLEALAAGQAERFTRQTQAAAQRGSGLRGALYTDNRWAVHPRLNAQFGLRLDLARVAAPVGFNAAVDSLFGARTDALPKLAAVSPRLGLQWRYGKPTLDWPPSAIAVLAPRCDW